MSSLFNGFSIGTKALNTAQSGINITGHNIANVNTPGYSRQIAHLEATEPSRYNQQFFGTGVNLQSISRAQNLFLYREIINQNGINSYLNQKRDILAQVEGLFENDEVYGIQNALEDFFNSFYDLSNDPQSSSIRHIIANNGQRLTQLVSDRYRNLQNIQGQYDSELKEKINQVNNITAQLADLNSKISSYGEGQNPNDFLDKRDLLLKELSEIIDISYYETDNNAIVVQIGGGQPIVAGSSNFELDTAVNPANNNFHDVYLNFQNTSVNVTGIIQGGETGAIIHTRDNVITEYLNRLDTFSNNLINSVNALHSIGFGIGGTTGENFFNDPVPGQEALNISLNSSIIADPDLIASGSTPSPGDNETALLIAGLANTKTIGNQDLFQYLGGLISKIGSDKYSVDKQSISQNAILSNLESRKEAISGVNLDEEAMDMIKFQRAYQAAARFISYVDNMTQVLINLV